MEPNSPDLIVYGVHSAGRAGFSRVVRQTGKRAAMHCLSALRSLNPSPLLLVPINSDRLLCCVHEHEHTHDTAAEHTRDGGAGGRSPRGCR